MLKAKTCIRYLEGLERILIISPQPWTGFKVSKHHYAKELAKLGNKVYFLNPPNAERRMRGIHVAGADFEHGRIETVDYRTWFPYIIKFHSKVLFDIGMRIQAKRILMRLGEKPTLVWDFDESYQFFDLRWFGAGINIFHPVDQVSSSMNTSKYADFVLSVDASITKRLTRNDAPTLIVPHGLCCEYEQYGIERLSYRATGNRDGSRFGDPIRVGYVGNLLARSIDRPAFLKIIDSHPSVQFELFGPWEVSEGQPKDIVEWLNTIRNRDNVRLHGLVSQERILQEAPKVHLWLVCYDSTLDQNGGTNSHKVLEYLATGSPVVSNLLDAYAESGLLVTPQEKGNRKLPMVFADAILRLPALHSVESRRQRIEYALEHGYRYHLKRIQEFINH